MSGGEPSGADAEDPAPAPTPVRRIRLGAPGSADLPPQPVPAPVQAQRQPEVPDVRDPHAVARGPQDSRGFGARIRSRRSVLAITVAAAAVIGLVAAVRSSPRGAGVLSPGASHGLRRVLSDSFTGPTLDPSRWATCYPETSDHLYSPALATGGCTRFESGDLEWFQPGEVHTGNGATLRARVGPVTGQARYGAPRSYPYASGMITTAGRYSFVFGYVEVAASLSQAGGTTSQISLLGEGTAYPEIDLARASGASPGAVIVGSEPSARSVGRVSHTVSLPALGPTVHVYGLRWQPGRLTWYVDGRKVLETEHSVPAQPMYLAIDLAVAPTIRPAEAAQLPTTTVVDAVSVYR